MKGVNRNGYVYPQVVPIRLRLRHIYEAVAPPLATTAKTFLKLSLLTLRIFKAPRLYTHEAKTRRGGFYL